METKLCMHYKKYIGTKYIGKMNNLINRGIGPQSPND